MAIVADRADLRSFVKAERHSFLGAVKKRPALVLVRTSLLANRRESLEMAQSDNYQEWYFRRAGVH